ncbi:class I SAM-dependent methyltransferase [Hymenobacter arcticus]
MNTLLPAAPAIGRPATFPCPVCGSTAGTVFYEVHHVPTQSGILWPTAEAARRAPTTDIRLTFCPHCHYMGNEAYEAAKVTHARNDFSLEFSPSFRAFTRALAQQLLDDYDLRGARVLDIGCGNGDFVRTLCELGAASGTGIDPGYAPPAGLAPAAPAGEATFLADYYDARYADLPVDLVSCRHMLNVIADPRAFVQLLRRNLGTQRPLVYVEVPNALYDIGEKVIWNIVNEHRSWFSPASLRWLFESTGFEVLAVVPCWHGEYLGLVARPVDVPATPPPAVRDAATPAAVRGFWAEGQRLVAQWQVVVDDLAHRHARVVAWGAGSRAIAFVNTYPALHPLLQAVVDINPQRQGQFMPGTAHPVIAPEAAVALAPDVLLVTNPTYAQEIRVQAHALGLLVGLLGAGAELATGLLSDFIVL